MPKVFSNVSMKYQFTPMKESYAEEIISVWHYDGAYSFYDMAADEGDMKIFTDKEYWKNTICAVLDENDVLTGWASFYTEDDDFWLSLGLRPDLAGRGLGEEFVSCCVRYAALHYTRKKQTIKLAVALFNERAIKVYQRAGFVESGRMIRDTHIGKVDFMEMEKHVPG